eukprot:gene6099-biopygen9219
MGGALTTNSGVRRRVGVRVLPPGDALDDRRRAELHRVVDPLHRPVQALRRPLRDHDHRVEARERPREEPPPPPAAAEEGGDRGGRRAEGAGEEGGRPLLVGDVALERRAGAREGGGEARARRGEGPPLRHRDGAEGGGRRRPRARGGVPRRVPVQDRVLDRGEAGWGEERVVGDGAPHPLLRYATLCDTPRSGLRWAALGCAGLRWAALGPVAPTLARGS